MLHSFIHFRGKDFGKYDTSDTDWFVPLNCRALPILPTIRVGVLTRVPVLPLPLASAALVPLVSSKRHQPVGLGAYPPRLMMSKVLL